uniref:Uncharacterized protein n=1 Tax=Daphnia galeata TaxID=27404 RepID=A0A8J2WC43_9CRUS|nr:unnamed protein product [Daphnia galeata]
MNDHFRKSIKAQNRCYGADFLGRTGDNMSQFCPFKGLLVHDTPENSEENPDSKLSYHQNEPFLMIVYRDKTQKEKLSLLVALPGGCDDVEFSLVGGGGGSSTARITYCWPKSLYNIDHIFGKSCQAPFHPKIMGFKKELENNRETVDAIP